jgi:Ca2+-binding EF-hand superfamily protein
VDKTILYLDKDKDGKISFEEFSQVIGDRSSRSDIADLLTVDKAAI